ncbi:hypothetical protein [Methylohalobius crimeensis]|uniref:hypothetical protein n=1 Tax=Methylohalobius crimeensis TaxID=244365 RepID=UPI0003B7B34B|nr:hypothetical protein [Methylohalobius crimeensis]
MKFKIFQNINNITAALAVGAFAMGIAPAANALSMYNADASLEFTLSGVTDANGGSVDSSGWSVEADGYVSCPG